MSLHDVSINDLSPVSETALENDDPILTTEEAQQYDHKLLRRYASVASSDAVTGKSTSLELKAYFTCQKTLGDYTND